MTQKKNRTENGLNLDAIDELLKDFSGADEIMGRGGLVEQLTKVLVERALKGELSHHLGYAKGEKRANGGGEDEAGNCRNGTSRKTLIGENGPMEVEIPRDRNGSFEPQLIRKGQRRFAEFDERIIAMYGRGMTVREIQGFLLEQYKVEVSPDFISTVTDSVIEAVGEWQNRPLEKLYPVVFFDALRVKIRDEGTVKNKAVYLALAIRSDGCKEVLGIWIEQNEGAKFWLKVMNELRNRGVEDILIAVVDGLKGFPDAITAAFPQTCVQTCIVHLMRNSLEFCSWQDRKAVASALKEVYGAASAEAAEAKLEEFAASKWGIKYSTIAAIWRRAWQQAIPFYAYPPEIRKVIYTTNAIESLHMQIRKVLKNRGHFPSDEAATKLIYLALRNLTKKWTKPLVGWKAAMNQFAIQYGDRIFTGSAR